MRVNDTSPETDPTVVMNIKLRESLKERLTDYAAQRGLSASAAVRLAITMMVDDADRARRNRP